jgi:hypothetical protein
MISHSLAEYTHDAQNIRNFDCSVPNHHVWSWFQILQVAAPSAPAAKTPRSSGKKPARKPTSAKKSSGKKPAATRTRAAARPASKPAAAAAAAAATPSGKGIAGTVYTAAAAFLTGLKRRLSTA